MNAATILAKLGAGFAAGLFVFGGILRQLWQVGDKTTIVIASLKTILLACQIYAISFLIYIIPRGPRSSSPITARSMAWFIVCSIPLLLFVPWGTCVAVVAIAWILIAQTRQRKNRTKS
jgi:hypothetical protein